MITVMYGNYIFSCIIAITDPNANLSNPSYDYEDESFEAKPEEDGKKTAENSVGNKDDEEAYHKFDNALLYYSTGPSTRVHSERDVNHYETDPLYQKPGRDVPQSHDDLLYADPASSQV